jgi:hypothetical protein
VFRYAVATARLASDPTRDLRGALTAPTVTHYGAITEAKKVGALWIIPAGKMKMRTASAPWPPRCSMKAGRGTRMQSSAP